MTTVAIYQDAEGYILYKSKVAGPNVLVAYGDAGGYITALHDHALLTEQERDQLRQLRDAAFNLDAIRKAWTAEWKALTPFLAGQPSHLNEERS